MGRQTHTHREREREGEGGRESRSESEFITRERESARESERETRDQLGKIVVKLLFAYKVHQTVLEKTVIEHHITRMPTIQAAEHIEKYVSDACARKCINLERMIDMFRKDRR